MNSSVLLVGTGLMSIEYAKILVALEVNVICVGRGDTSANKFEEVTGVQAFRGGLKEYLLTHKTEFSYAIIAVSVENLFETALNLIEYNCKHILIEKPGALEYDQFLKLQTLASAKKISIFIGYNRRFYASVLKAQDIIKEDGGLTSFHFEFTEWVDRIPPTTSALARSKWFLANSSHVVDMAFYLGGFPKEINCFYEGSFPWHQSASRFCGAGLSIENALFTYNANWNAPGRWKVELMTENYRLLFAPLEKLQVQKRSELDAFFVEIDNENDLRFKPGLFLQTKLFLSNETENFVTLDAQTAHYALYAKMSGE